MRTLQAIITTAILLGLLAAPAAAGPIARTPNMYSLHDKSGDLNITYSMGALGKSNFQYQTPDETLNFSGGQIRKVKTEIGTLVTVTIYLTIDTGSTTFTLFVPTVNLGQATQMPIDTFGVTTMHRFSVIPSFNQGQTETYTVTDLTGTAELAAF